MSHHHHGLYSHTPGHHFYGAPPAAADAMRVDQLLDLSYASAAGDANNNAGGGGASRSSTEPPSAAAAAPYPASSGYTSFNLSFSDEFYLPVPSEEAAELEWLSNFVDDSYPDMPSYPPEVQAAIAAQAQVVGNSSSTTISAAPGRGARSKRSRATSAAAWHHSLSPSSSDSKSTSPGGGGARRCTHCASERTPQWRTGPLGPKTLCNACGVRYKSGRLVPEYRPAASPTFVLTQHSNSHRKVMELRRQKESSGASGSACMFRDYGVC